MDVEFCVHALPGLGALKRKKPKLAALAAAGIKPVRTAEKNTRLLWRADVVAEPAADGCDSGARDVTLHLAGTGFLYRYVCARRLLCGQAVVRAGCASSCGRACVVRAWVLVCDIGTAAVM